MAAMDYLKMYKLAQSAMDGLIPILRSNAVMPKLIKHIPNNTQVPIQGAVTSANVTARSAGSAMTTVAPPTETAANFRITSEAEYVAPIDVLNKIAMKPFDYLNFYMNKIVASLADTIDNSIWDLYSSVTQTAGSAGATPAVSDLATAKKELRDAKVNFSDPSKLHCVIGAEEEEAWLSAATWNAQGPISQASIMEGSLGRRYGFNLWVDQNRATSGTTAYNLCFHEDFAGIAFTDQYDHHRSVAQVSVTDPVSGLTIFVQDWPMDEATYGVGQKYRFVVPYDTAVLDVTRACQLLGGVEE